MVSNENTVNNIMSVVQKYLNNLSELDEETLKELYKNYGGMLQNLFDENGISGVDVLDVMDSINGEVRLFSKKFDTREDRRDELKYDTLKNGTNAIEKFREENDVDPINTTQKMVMDISDDVQKLEKDEKRELHSCVEEMVEIANNTVASQLASHGYYDLEDFKNDLKYNSNRIAMQLLGEYDENIKSKTNDVIEKIDDEVDKLKGVYIDSQSHEPNNEDKYNDANTYSQAHKSTPVVDKKNDDFDYIEYL